MIFLFLDAIDDGRHRTFSCCLNSLADSLDFVQTVAKRGSTLQKVCVLDELNQPIDIPVHVFEGTSFASAFVQLESQWRAVLDHPLHQASTFHQERINWVKKRLDQYQMQVNTYNRVIELTEALYKRTSTKAYSTAVQSRLLAQYLTCVRQNQLYLRKAQAGCTLLAERLDGLVAKV